MGGYGGGTEMNRIISYHCMECGTSVVVDIEEYIDNHLFCNSCKEKDLSQENNAQIFI